MIMDLEISDRDFRSRFQIETSDRKSEGWISVVGVFGRSREGGQGHFECAVKI